jgi:hypothetical protein
VITWQDPVALGLAALLVGLAWWWRRWLIRRGQAPQCTQCQATGRERERAGERAAVRPPPASIPVERLRLSRARPAVGAVPGRAPGFAQATARPPAVL